MSLLAPFSSSPEHRFQELLRAARNGSSEARWLVVQLFRQMLLSVANKEVDHAIHAREAPSDIVQETIVEAQRDLDQFRGMTEAEMMAWLRMVLKRNLLNLNSKYRTAKRDLDRERTLNRGAGGIEPRIADPGPSPSTVLSLRERDRAIDEAIDGLPDRYRQIIELRYRKGLSFAQIALMIDRTEEAARRRWSRALHQLSMRLKQIEA